MCDGPGGILVGCRSDSKSVGTLSFPEAGPSCAVGSVSEREHQLEGKKGAARTETADVRSAAHRRRRQPERREGAGVANVAHTKEKSEGPASDNGTTPSVARLNRTQRCFPQFSPDYQQLSHTAHFSTSSIIFCHFFPTFSRFSPFPNNKAQAPGHQSRGQNFSGEQFLVGSPRKGLTFQNVPSTHQVHTGPLKVCQTPSLTHKMTSVHHCTCTSHCTSRVYNS